MSTNWPGPRCRGEEESEEDEEESEPEAEHVAYSDGVPNEDSNTPESKYALRQSPISRYHDDMSKEEGVCIYIVWGGGTNTMINIH